jgi:hypothetical protein
MAPAGCFLHGILPRAGFENWRNFPRAPRARRPAALPNASQAAAEIKSCCRLASLLEVPLVQAAQHVVPVAVTAGEKIEGLRQWASGRCLSANRAGVYSS